MTQTNLNCTIDQQATADLRRWAETLEGTADLFAAAQARTRRLGARWRDGRAQVGFWVPDCVDKGLADLFLEILRPPANIDLTADQQTITWQRQLLPLTLVGECAWGVYNGLQPGTRDQIGDFYRLTYKQDGAWVTLLDPLANSVPFGGKAPGELIDWAGMDANRADRDHFQRLDTAPDPDGVPRVGPPVNILQLHVNTASADGTLAGLREVYEAIARKIEAGEPLTPAEENYIGYDSIQLMPIEPIIEYEAGPLFWEDQEVRADGLVTTLRKPTVTNWGYDVLTVASPAVNPCVLRTKRPHELVDFIAALHNFPGKPIKVLFDIVYGHTDNQTLPYLNSRYFAGPNMYGQNLTYTDPMVRAILLEMQKRKNDFGIDGVRVDGAQDFKNYNPDSGQMEHDDEYLQLMNDIEQEVAGVRYRPWMIFEDGRPWPREDWELASTYREVTKLFPNVVQWGPLTFAHNTPFLFTFWANKWWRIREMMEVGSHWITGCANHDTLRRGTQVSPEARVNTYLGKTLLEIYQNGYDNPAAKLFDYTLCPGIPMDFINAAMRAPWSFIRNTDDKWGVKVVSEEAFFLDWALNEERFAREFAYPRLKGHGFTTLEELRRFLRALDGAVKMTNYDLAAMAGVLNAMQPPFPLEFTPAVLKQVARAWMDDVHDFINVSHWTEAVDGRRSHYNRQLREFRRARPYLQGNLGADEHFGYLHPTEGAMIVYGLRQGPDGEQLLIVLNMEGEPKRLVPAALPVPGLTEAGWELVLETPGLGAGGVETAVSLPDSSGVVYLKRG